MLINIKRNCVYAQFLFYYQFVGILKVYIMLKILFEHCKGTGDVARVLEFYYAN